MGPDLVSKIKYKFAKTGVSGILLAAYGKLISDLTDKEEVD